jgi:hypothetical protein
MHTLNPAKHLVTLAILGILAGAIVTSPLPDKRMGYRTDTFAQTATNLDKVDGNAQSEFANAWQKLKSISEGQIRDNDERILQFKAQRARGSRIFRAVYDKRVAELERRNIDIRGKLKGYVPFPSPPRSSR